MVPKNKFEGVLGDGLTRSEHVKTHSKEGVVTMEGSGRQQGLLGLQSSRINWLANRTFLWHSGNWSQKVPRVQDLGCQHFSSFWIGCGGSRHEYKSFSILSYRTGHFFKQYSWKIQKINMHSLSCRVVSG